MNHGRPTSDPKPNRLIIRLNDEMAEWIERESRRTGNSISDIAREAIRLLMKNNGV